MSAWRRGFLSSGLGLCLIASGCSSGLPDAARAITKVRKMVETGQTDPNRVWPKVTLPVFTVDLKKLTPYAGGKGVVICEPVSKSDAGSLAFGTACSRWLHFAVAGQPQLTKTPLWDSVDAARIEMAQPHLRFSVDRAKQLAAKVAATHVATTEFSGNASRCTLTVKLWQMPDKVAEGKVLAITGSRKQILAQMPELARKLSGMLGVAQPRPLPIAASAEEFQFLGNIPWAAQKDLPKAERSRLENLAKKVPLAAMLQLGALNSQAWDPGNGDSAYWDVKTPVATLIKVASSNALALAQCAWHAPGLIKAQRNIIDAAAKKHPQNFLLATAEMCWYRTNAVSPGRARETAAAQRAVRSARANPVAWLGLSETTSQVADDVRQGRFSRDISPTEHPFLDKVYAVSYECSLRAIKLDPRNFTAHVQNSATAMFAGKANKSYDSLAQAIAIRPGDFRGYNWALQILQPKWGGDTADLLDIVEVIKSDPILFEKLHNKVHYALEGSGLKREMRKFDGDYVDFVKVKVAKSPADIEIQKDLADALYNVERFAEAAPIYLKVTQANPKNANAHYAYGWIEHYVNGNYGVAEQHYVAAIAADPRHSDAINALGDITYYVHGDYMKAEELYRKAISIKDDGLYHAELARLMLDQGRHAAAVGRAKRAIELGYTDPINPIWERLGIDPNK